MGEIKLNDRVAIVTGGGRGLGRAMAKALADAGARVVLAAPDSDMIEAAAKSINESCGRNCAFAITADITSVQDCQRVLNESVSRFGGLHVLVNNARRLQRGPGLPPDGNTLPFWRSNPTIWQETVHVNVNGSFLISHIIAPHLIQQKWGRIVNVTTSLDTMQRANNSPYGVTKAALEAATLIWAQDLAGTGVTVNSLIPGGRVDTDPNRTASASSLPLDVMNAAIVWLASDLSNDKTAGRYVGKLWDTRLPPNEAAARAIEPPVFRSPDGASR